MKKQIVTLLLVAALGSVGVVAAANEAKPTGKHVESLTLDQALEMAESLQPQLAEAKAMVDAAEGRARQAGTFPNPEAVVGAQQIPFRGNAPNEKEYVAGVGLTIPLSRRLSKAREAELLDREVRARGLEMKRRETRKRVHSAFATALYQEKACQAQTEIQQNAVKAVATTQARVEAGDALREDLARVEMELARAKVELKRAESLREQALVALASAIGDTTLSVRSLAGTLDATFEIPTLETLAATLSAQPESAQAEADLRARNALVDVAKSERIPDVKVELLYHRLEASRENTFDMGLSIPLPLFNRNQGRLREARAEVAAAEARSRMTQNELATRLRESHLQLTTALANSGALKTEILSRAETVLKGAEARYAAGDISLAEILPVRRDWAAVQLSYLESLRDAMQAWAEVKMFTNAH
ncbi:MAG: TolC family protein [Chloroflexi bacterium]|nr:TolC family protein [Chloroflexota bacterium]